MMNLCILAATIAFSIHAKGKDISEQSHGYQYAWAKVQLGPKVAECLRLGRIARQLGGDELWVVATSVVESGLDNSKVSKAGAKSSMQTYRKFSRCGRKCDLRESGARIALNLLGKYHPCGAAARYNVGPKGRCGGKGDYYATLVMRVYVELFEAEK